MIYPPHLQLRISSLETLSIDERFAVLHEVTAFVNEEHRVHGCLRDFYPDVFLPPKVEQLEGMGACGVAPRPSRRWLVRTRRALADWFATAKRGPPAQGSRSG